MASKRGAPRLIVTYRGVNMYRNTAPGYGLRWTAGRLAADTQAGLRQLIREEAQSDA